MKKLVLIAVFMLVIALTAAAHAADEDNGGKKVEAQSAESDEVVETTVFSDRMKSESDKNRIRFTGNVVAHHGEMTVKSNELEVYSGKDQKKMEVIIAIGDVTITTKNHVMKSSRAEMYQKEKKLVLTGNASITQGESNITGEKIIYYYDKEDIIVGGGANERATFKVTPAKEKPEQGK